MLLTGLIALLGRVQRLVLGKKMEIEKNGNKCFRQSTDGARSFAWEGPEACNEHH